MSDIIDSTSAILDEISKQLDGVTLYMDNLTEQLNKEIKNKSEQAQEIVDSKMEEFSNKLTSKLQPIRNKIVNIFASQFSVVKEKVEKFIAPISPFVSIDWSTGVITPNIPTNPNELPKVLTGMISMLIPSPAIEFAAKFATQLFPKIQVISNKIQQIATYQPKVETPDVEVPSLSVNVEPITIGDITGG